MPPRVKRTLDRSPTQNQNDLPASMLAKERAKRARDEDDEAEIPAEQKTILHAQACKTRLIRLPLAQPDRAAKPVLSKLHAANDRTATASRLRKATPGRGLGQEVSAPHSSARRLATGENNHLMVEQGDIVQERYEVVQFLGVGTFGQVVAVRDKKKRSDAPEFALKITQGTREAKEDWNFEKDTLFRLNELDRTGSHHIVRLFNAFMYYEHPCLVFERLFDSLHHFLQTAPFRPLTMSNLASIARQLCDAVAFLHSHGLTHTDLKPENIAFAVPTKFRDVRTHQGNRYTYTRTLDSCEVRVIDFGSAVNVDDYHGIDVTTRQYRSPEVMLELEWTFPIDVWSLGCILHEIYTGKILFRFPTVRDQLGAMERILGTAIPSSMSKHSRATALVQKGKFTYDDTAEGWAAVQKAGKLQDTKRDNEAPTVQFFELLIAMLRLEPRYRITLPDALKHPFFALFPPTNTSSAVTGGAGTRSKRKP